MSLTLATVTQLSPLQVTTDGSATGINAINVCGQKLVVSSRVLVDTIDRQGGQLAIVGSMGSSRQASGIATIAAPTINTYSSVAVAFPIGLFATAPHVALGCLVSGTGSISFVGFDSLTSLGMNVGVVRSAVVSTPVHWIATVDST